MHRFQRGDSSAFGELYERYAPAVRRVCRSRLRTHDLAEDAVQETFLKAYRALDRYDGRMPVQRWLRRIARNHCIDVLRRSTRVSALTDGSATGIDAPDPDSESLFDAVTLGLDLQAVLAELSWRDRQLLLSHHVHDVSVDRLAQRWDMTAGSMAVALHRARRRARERGGLDLLGLGGVAGWWHRRRAAVDRISVAVEAAGPSLGQVVAAHAAIAAAVLLPTVFSGATASADEALDVVLQHPPGWSVDAGHEAVGARPRAGSPGPVARPASADASGEEQDGDVPVIGSPRVEVPATSVAIHREDPGSDPQVRYGARLRERGQEAEISVESHREDRLAPADRVACTLAQMGEPVTYCE